MDSNVRSLNDVLGPVLSDTMLDSIIQRQLVDIKESKDTKKRYESSIIMEESKLVTENERN